MKHEINRKPMGEKLRVPSRHDDSCWKLFQEEHKKDTRKKEDYKLLFSRIVLRRFILNITTSRRVAIL